MSNILPIYPAQRTSPQLGTRFRHDPLDHNRSSLRILKVFPKTYYSNDIECEIHNSSIGDEYTCLSYTWGDHSPKYAIRINGQTHLVWENLWEFLKVAQEKYPMKPLWIDALCINQSSIQERNHQVAQMGQIYKSATRVIAWLGSSNGVTDLFKMWKWAQRRAQGSCSEDLNESYYNVAMHTLSTAQGVSCWSALAKHPYWTRAWITQEIALAKSFKLLAGRIEVDVQLLEYTANLGFYSEVDIDTSFLTHVHIALGMKSLAGMSLVNLLSGLPNQNCGNTRDRINALLGLAADGANFVPDYGSSTTELLFSVIQSFTTSICLCSFGLLLEVLDLYSERSTWPILADLVSNPILSIPVVEAKLCLYETPPDTFTNNSRSQRIGGSQIARQSNRHLRRVRNTHRNLPVLHDRPIGAEQDCGVYIHLSDICPIAQGHVLLSSTGTVGKQKSNSSPWAKRHIIKSQSASENKLPKRTHVFNFTLADLLADNLSTDSYYQEPGKDDWLGCWPSKRSHILCERAKGSRGPFQNLQHSSSTK